MEDLKIKSKYLKLCYQFRAFIRYMKAAFYRPDFQKLLISPLIKLIDQAFIPKHAAKPLKHSDEFLKHVVEFLKGLEKTGGSMESLQSSTECLKSSVACFCYNTAHAILISYGTFHILAQS